ncbi:MAG TPA: amidohydrolase family protein [Thermomicrobiales bacterium]|nr:amidohydrolase family protein [Thermomicrobiales bacterium]
MNNAMIIRNVRPIGQDALDILVRDGHIAAIGPSLATDDAAEEIDGAGRLLFQGMVDAHTHMDKTLLGLPWHRHTTGSALLDKIEGERRLRQEEGIDAHQQSARHAERAIVSGTTHIRSFADIDTEWELNGFRGLMQTREDLKDRVTIQIVAFPQSGMLVRPGTVELMEQALREGADVVGGLDPSTIDRDPKGHLDTIFALAEKYDVDVDIHLHEPGELGAFDMELIAERTLALGMEGRVTISHAFALGGVDPARYEHLVDLILGADIAIMSHGPSGGKPAPPIGQLRAAGVRMCAGNDGIQDAWGPLNRPEMLLRAYLIAYRNNFRRDDEIEDVIDIITNGGADAMRVEDYGFAEGASADLVLVDGETHVSAVINQPVPWLVMKHGRIAAREGQLA